MPTTVYKPLRIPIQALQRDGFETCVYCLDSRFVEALLSVTERFFWSTCWVEDGGKIHKLSEDELKIISKGVYELNGCLSLDSLTELLSDIQEAVQELKELQVNVNVSNSGCGCGCGCGSNPNAPSDDTFPPGQNPPPTGDTSTTDLEWLCKAAEDVVNRYVQFWNNVTQYASVGVSANVLEGILDALLIFFSFGQPVALLLTYIGQYLTESFGQSMAGMFESLRPAIVSAITTASDASAAESAVKNIVWASSYPLPQRLAGYALVDLADWDKVFTADSWEAPESANCGGVPQPGVCWLPAGWESQKAQTIVEHQASEFTVSKTFTPNAGSDDCGSYSLVQYTANLDDKNQTWEPIWKALFQTEASEAQGYVIETVFNEAIGGNSPADPIARVGFDLDHTEVTDGSYDRFAVNRFVAIRGAYEASFSPLEGTAIQELQVIEDADWDFDLEYVFVKFYKRSGVSNTKFGGVGISVKFYYLRQA